MDENVLVVTDIHSNLEAFEAVMKDSEKHGPYESMICAGDLVGYEPNPNEVVEIIKSAGIHCVLGNHDRAVRGGYFGDFHSDAAECVVINRQLANNQTKKSLNSLSPFPYRDPRNRFLMVHGSFGAPRDRDHYEDAYITNEDDARNAILGLRDIKKSGLDGVTIGIYGHHHKNRKNKIFHEKL